MMHRFVAAPELLLRLVRRRPRVAVGASGLGALLLFLALAAFMLNTPV